MYSKEHGVTYSRPEGQRSFPQREPAYRQSLERRGEYGLHDRPRMQVPTNYSGYAIVDGEERVFGNSETSREPEGGMEMPETDGPTPRCDDLPRVSDLPRGGTGEARRRPPPTVNATFEESVGHGGDEGKPPPTSEVVRAATPSRGGLFDLSRFPFGRGIGFEELMILGLILLLLHESAEGEERGDIDETVILLGLLLLLG